MADERIKVKSSDIEKLIEWLRRSEQPQTLEALTHEFIRIAHEEVNGKGR